MENKNNKIWLKGFYSFNQTEIAARVFYLFANLVGHIWNYSFSFTLIYPYVIFSFYCVIQHKEGDINKAISCCHLSLIEVIKLHFVKEG